jgi:hypothetical protein
MERPRSGTERTPCCRRAHRPQRADHATRRIGHETAPNRLSRLLSASRISPRSRRLIARGTGGSNPSLAISKTLGNPPFLAGLHAGNSTQTEPKNSTQKWQLILKSARVTSGLGSARGLSTISCRCNRPWTQPRVRGLIRRFPADPAAFTNPARSQVHSLASRFRLG